MVAKISINSSKKQFAYNQKNGAMMKKVDMALGKRLKKERNAKGLTQGELGKRLGISPQQVQKYEMGINRVSVSRLVQITEILGLNIEHIMLELSQSKQKKSRISTTLHKANEETLSTLIPNFKHIDDHALIIDIAKRLAT